ADVGPAARPEGHGGPRLPQRAPVLRPIARAAGRLRRCIRQWRPHRAEHAAHAGVRTGAVYERRHRSAGLPDRRPQVDPPFPCGFRPTRRGGALYWWSRHARAGLGAAAVPQDPAAEMAVRPIIGCQPLLLPHEQEIATLVAGEADVTVAGLLLRIEADRVIDLVGDAFAV